MNGFCTSLGFVVLYCKDREGNDGIDPYKTNKKNYQMYHVDTVYGLKYTVKLKLKQIRSWTITAMLISLHTPCRILLKKIKKSNKNKIRYFYYCVEEATQ